MDYREAYDAFVWWVGLPAWLLTAYIVYYRLKNIPRPVKLHDRLFTWVIIVLLSAAVCVDISILFDDELIPTKNLGAWLGFPPAIDVLLTFVAPMGLAWMINDRLPSFSFKIKKKF